MAIIQELLGGDYVDESLVKINANFNNLNTDKAENSDLNAHIEDTNNPHEVTKEQVGLGNVPNLDTSPAVANEHTHTNKAILDATEVSISTQEKLRYQTGYEHTLLKNNPHQTKISNISDVILTSPVDHDVLMFDGLVWRNSQAILGNAGGTHYNNAESGLASTNVQDAIDEVYSNFSNYSLTSHNHSGVYDPIGTASGIMGTHELNYNHSLIATALQTEIDPIFNAWDKSSGISITESQISDFKTYSTDIHSNITALNLVSGTNTGDQDLTGLVPYTGATGDLNMGIHNIYFTGNINDTTAEELANFKYVSAGCLAVPTLTDNGNGSIVVGNVNATFYKNSTFIGVPIIVSLTGISVTLTDNATNYIIGDYNNGTPIMRVTLNVLEINESNIIPIYTIYRSGNVLHTTGWDELGLGLATKLHYSIVKTQRYRRESGLAISELGTRNLKVTGGIVWIGSNRVAIDEVLSASDNIYLYHHTAGNWTYTLVTQYNNTQYDNGTALTDLTANRYSVNWVYRGIETQKHVYITLGTGDYTLAQAQVAQPPTPPTAISSHGMLVGKIIIQKSSATAYSIASAFDIAFVTSGASTHNDLSGIQGGTAGEYYHLSNAQYTIATQSATTTRDGYLTSTDWNTFNSKEPSITAGITSQYWRGDKTWQTLTLPANTTATTNEFFTAYNSSTGAFTKARPTWANIDKTTSNIADITTRSHTSLTDIGTNTHAQIDTFIASKGNANGLATLDAGGKVPVSQLPNSIMQYQGAWNATTNTPTLADGTGDAGDVYITNVAGTQNLGSGSITFEIGDWVIYNGTIWQKSDSSDAVASVFGRTGAVTAQSGDYNSSQVTENTNLYFTNTRAIGATLTGYTATNGTISATDTILQAIQKLGYDKHVAVTLGTANGLSLSTQALSLGLSSTSTTGALSNTDWNTFNGKQAALVSGTNIKTVNSNSLLGAGNVAVGTVTSVAMTVPTGLSISGTPITTSGTLALTFTAGYSIPTDANQTNWTTAYTNRITSLTTTGSSGAATLSSNTLNIPNYTLAGLGGLPLSGGTMTGVIDNGTSATTGYRFGGRSFSWNSSMQTPTTNVPHIMQDSYAGWDPIIGIKTTNGFWQFGAYSNDEIHLGYMAGAFGGHPVNNFDNSVSITPTLMKVGNVGTMGLTVSGNITGASIIKSGGTSSQFLKADGSVDSNTYYLTSNPSSYISLTSLSSTATGLTYTNTTGVFSLTSGYAIPTTTKQTEWDTAYTDRNKWDGGSTGLVAATGRTSLGGTTVGSNIFTIVNPSAITFLRINADNTVSALDATTFRTAIGAGTSTVTPAALTKTDDTNITLTLGGTPATSLLQAVSLTLGWTGTLADARITSAATWNAKQTGHANLTSLSGLTYASAAFVKMTGANTFTLDTNTYLTAASTLDASKLSGAIPATVTQTEWDSAYTFTNGFTTNYADLVAIEALAGTSGFLKKTAANTWALDTSTYLTGNQTITLSGGATGSGATAITVSLTTPASVTGISTNTGGTGAHTHAVSGLVNANLSGSAGITNANLANDSVTIGTTEIALGASSTTLAGLTSVTSTSFTGHSYIPVTGVLLSNLGAPTVGEIALVPSEMNNKLFCYDYTKTVYEYTTDDSTWNAWSVSDANKKGLLTANAGGTATITNGWLKARITLECNSYVYLNNLYLYASTSGHSMYLTIQKSYDGSTWENIVANSGAKSTWPGHLFLPHNTIPWNPTPTLGTHFKYVRIIFTPTWNGTYPANNITINDIQWFGGYPAAKREIYSWNYDKDVTFPADLLCVGLNVSGLTASKLVFTDASKNLTSTGIGTSAQFIKGDGSLDSSTYLTGNQSITLTGAITGSGTTSIATTIATPGTLTVSSTNSTATAHTHAITTSVSPGAAAAILATGATGHIGATGGRIVKGWFTDLEVTNAIVGSITGNAATITVADESADTACYVLFATAASGSLAAKTAAGLTFNASTDVLSGTFSGNITGNVTGNCSGSAATVTGATQTAITTLANLTTVGTIGTGIWQGTDVGLAYGGTNASLTAANGGIVYSTASALALTAAGSAGQVLKSNGATAPTWQTLDLTYLPDAAFKKSVKAATTANITLSAPQTIDGISCVAGDRVLVKDQTAPAENGIYQVNAGAWTRTADADAISEMAGATVNVDSGTLNGGILFSNNIKITDTLGTTAMPWYYLLNSLNLVTSGAATGGAVYYNGTTNTAGQFYGGTTTPTGTTRLNYSGYFYPTYINLSASGDTATAATHYFVETGTDGYVRPKTLANVKTEIVTTAAVNAAAATTVGDVTSGTWSATAIAADYGGTGQTVYAVGDILYASTTTALSKLADVATGNALISGGVNTAPSYGKIGLTTHISGTLPIANGGTNSTTLTSRQVMFYDGTSILGDAGLVFETRKTLTLNDGLYNIGIGTDALLNNTFSRYNIAIGNNALRTLSFTNTETNYNTFNIAIGSNALFSLEPTSFDNGRANLAIGYNAGYYLTTGFSNIIIGQAAGYYLTNGNDNTLVGFSAGDKMTTAFNNTCIGESAGHSLSTGGYNTFIGDYAAYYGDGTLTGNSNTGIGASALYSITTTASGNVAVGHQCGQSLTTGFSNVLLGANAGTRFTTGAYNISIGTASGSSVTTNGNYNLYIGVGNMGGNESNTIRIQNVSSAYTYTYIQGIYGQISASGIAVLVNSSHKLGTTTSSIRYKENVVDMDDYSSKILDLRPVMFDYKGENVDKHQPGLIAEEVNEIMPELVAWNFVTEKKKVKNEDGKEEEREVNVKNEDGTDKLQIESVRYLNLIPLMLNEIKKLKKEIEELRNG